MPRRKPDPAALEARIGYAFANRELLDQALTHVSAAGGAYAKSYQRLEFLGDRVLGLAIAEMLYAAFPAAGGRTLAPPGRARPPRELRRDRRGLGAWPLSPDRQQARRRSGTNRAILADVCEAVIGAVFLDGGYPAAHAVIETAFGPRLKALAKPPSNPKAVLQEWAHARSLPTPAYEMVEQTGPDHAPRFRIAAKVQGLEAGRGHRLLEAHRRAGRGREPPPARGRVEASREAGITGRQDAGAGRRAPGAAAPADDRLDDVRAGA